MAEAHSNAMHKLTAEPLYARVRKRLVERLISGDWKPGAMLPSEFAIAAELGVSQGTVRKALDEMTAEGILERQQGRGTFVAKAEDTSILFRFYRLTRNELDKSSEEREGNAPAVPTFPRSSYLSEDYSTASQEERDLFAMTDQVDPHVWRFERLRFEGEQPILWERLVLPSHRFPNLRPHLPLPNNVYQFYGDHFSTIVAKVREKLRALTAPDPIAEHLGLPIGSPVLEIDRRAIALDGEVVERRLSLCRSDTMHYRNELK